jgi:hypothetical protein
MMTLLRAHNFRPAAAKCGPVYKFDNSYGLPLDERLKMKLPLIPNNFHPKEAKP